MRIIAAMLSVLAGFVLASVSAAATFRSLGSPTLGIDFDITGVSDDGGKVFGSIYAEAGPQTAFVWTPVDSFTPHHDAFGFDLAFSENGNSISGYGGRVPGSEAFRWQSGTLAGISKQDGDSRNSIAAFGISGNGQVVVGESSYFLNSQDYVREAFSWTPTAGVKLLGLLPDDLCCSSAYDASRDGNVIVGSSGISNEVRPVQREAVRWLNNGSPQRLGHVGADGDGRLDSVATSVSLNGEVVIGMSSASSGRTPFRWTPGGGMSGLERLTGGGGNTTAWDLSADGSLIVGESANAAVLWDSAGTAHDLQALLQSKYGLDKEIAGWQLNSATAASPSGRFISGYGTNPEGKIEGWLVDLNRPRHLILVTHGWLPEGAAASWPSSTANTIKELIENSQGADAKAQTLAWQENQPIEIEQQTSTTAAIWDVASFDWLDSANTLLPFAAGSHGTELGKGLASSIIGEYDTVHLIAHSAGSWLIDAVADRLAGSVGPQERSTKLHLTFLDAFAPPGKRRDLGEHSDWSEQYVNTDDFLALFTNRPLEHAFNIDVTLPDFSPIAGHGWPVEWYEKTAAAGFLGGYGWGLQQSREKDDVLPSHNDFKRGMFVDLVTFESKETSQEIVELADLSITELASTTSETGAVEFLNGEALLSTGSDVWLELQIATNSIVNVLAFDYEFLNGSDALLTATFDGLEIFLAGKKNSLPGGETTELLWLGDDYQPGIHSLRFTLEPRSTESSHLRLGNVQIGRHSIIPEPRAGVLASLSAVLAHVSLRVLRRREYYDHLRFSEQRLSPPDARRSRTGGACPTPPISLR